MMMNKSSGAMAAALLQGLLRLGGMMLILVLSIAPGQGCVLPVVAPNQVCVPVTTLEENLAQAHMQLLMDERGQLHCQAAALDALLQHDEAKLLAQLEHADPVQRLLAAEAIGLKTTVSEAGMRRLLDRLADGDPRVVKRATETIAVLLSPGTPLGGGTTLSRLAEARPRLLEALLAPILDIYGSQDRKTAQLAGAVLAAFPTLPEKIVQGLCSGIENANTDIMPVYARALARSDPSCAERAWLGVLTKQPSSVSHCAAHPPIETWSEALDALTARGQSALHPLLKNAAAQSYSYSTEYMAAQMWAIAKVWQATALGPEDATMLAEVIARYPDMRSSTQPGELAWPVNGAMAWPTKRYLLEAMVDLWTRDRSGRYGEALRKLSIAQWQALDVGLRERVANQLLSQAQSRNTDGSRTVALSLLGAFHYQQVPDAAELAAVRLALSDRDWNVAGGAVIALASFYISDAEFRDALRSSTLVKGTDVSALIMMEGGESATLRQAASRALEVLAADHGQTKRGSGAR